VRYKKVSFLDRDKYFNQIPQKYDAEDTTASGQKPISFNPLTDEESDIELTGSKTISIDVGNKQGTGLDQATRIDVKGNLGGVEVSAQLSDVGNPIPPEGTTKELAEFDKILISLKTDKYQALYGDNDLNVGQGALGTINKKVLGVLLKRKADSGVRSADLGYAKSKGIYKKVLFNGKDNKQGPYLLNQDCAIVPGTENVYLNGQRLIRGQTQDYTIDYSQGSVTFTNRQIINSFSRLEIDFEYTTEDYNRYLWLANSQLQIGDGLKMSAGVYNESDDKSQNLIYSLSNADIEYLKNAGAESSYAWLSGVKYTGQGNGDYIKQDSIFVYAGQDSGDYDVQFTYVGYMQGDYVYDNPFNRFLYAGERLGSYVIGRRVQLPGQNRIYNASLNFDLPYGLNFNIDGFLSQRTRNLFARSSRSGLGYLFNGGYNKERFKLNYHRKEFDNNFYFPGTYKSVDFNFKWAGNKQESLKNSDEIETQLKLVKTLLLNGGAGWIKSFDNKTRQRYFASGNISPSENYDLASFSIEHYPNLLDRYSINLSPQYKIFKPEIKLFWENGTSQKQRYILPSLQIKLSQTLDVRLSSDFKRSILQNKKENEVYKIETDFTKDDINISGLIGYQNNKTDNIKESDNFFGNLTAQVSIFSGLSASLEYLQQQGETQKIEIYYVWAGQGQGKYKKNPETGEYYFDPQGDYIQENRLSGAYNASRTRNLQANWNFYKWQFVNFDGYISYNNQFGQSADLQTASNYQLNLSILPFDKNFTMKLINNYEYSEDNYANILALHRTYNNYRAEINSQKIDNIPITLSLEYNRQISERINLAVEQERKEQVFTLSPTFGFGVNVKSEISYNRSMISKPLYYWSLGWFYLHKIKFALERNWAIDKLTNLNSRVSVMRITSSIGRLPYDLNLIEPIGVTPELKITLDRIIQSELSSAFKQIILGGDYSFVKYPDRPAEHNFTMKLQANF